MAAKQVPVAAFPFPVLVNETVTKQAPVGGSAVVDQTVAAAGGGGGAKPFFRGFSEMRLPSPLMFAALALGRLVARNPITTRRRLLIPPRS